MLLATWLAKSFTYITLHRIVFRVPKITRTARTLELNYKLHPLLGNI